MTDSREPALDPVANPVLVLGWTIRYVEERGFPFGGIARRALQELAAGHTGGRSEGGCERCGGEVVQPWTGRRRKFCYSCSPARKKPGKRQHAA